MTTDIYATHRELLKTITYCGFFILTVYLVSSHRRVTIVIYTIIMAALLQGTIGIYATLLEYENAARGTFPNSNHFAGYLEMAIALGIGMMVAMLSPSTEDNRLLQWMETITGPKGRLRIVLVILVVGLVMSTSRMGNIALFTAVIIAGLIFSYIGRRMKGTVMLFLGSILIIDAAIIGNYFGLDRVSQRVQNLSMQTEMRDELNLLSLEIIKDNPLTGTGAGTFVHVFPQYRTPDIRVHFTHAENDYFEFLLELGIVGCIPLCLILVVRITTQMNLLRAKETQFVKGVAFGCLLGTVSLLIHATADFNLRIPSNAVVFVLLLALPYALVRNRLPTAP